MDFSFLTKKISPSKGVDMLKAGIEAIVKEPVEHFEVIYMDEKEEIFFRVWLVRGVIFEPYTGANKEMIVFAVKNLAKMNLKENETLDIVKCERVPDGSVNINVFSTIDGEKIHTPILNYKP